MKNLLLIVVASSFVAIAGSTLAQAQVVDTIVADVPFGFIVRDTTLPAGKYTIKRLDSINPSAMEIRSADGTGRLVFIAGSALAVKLPDQTELVFDRIGDQYFLSKIFEVADRSGVELQKSRAERQLEKLAKEGELGQLDSVVIPAHTDINASR